MIRINTRRTATEVRKEDDTYYQGAFWIIAETFSEIMRGNGEIVDEGSVFSVRTICGESGEQIFTRVRTFRDGVQIFPSELRVLQNTTGLANIIRSELLIDTSKIEMHN